jgi:hypothetical protein
MDILKTLKLKHMTGMVNIKASNFNTEPYSINVKHNMFSKICLLSHICGEGMKLILKITLSKHIFHSLRSSYIWRDIQSR